MTDTVRFILNGKVEALHDIDPTMTVLNYLRTVALKRGTKEGCAEGDCGACTVVLGELEDGRVRYRAVNSCLLFVPTLHGKQLLTVEDLKAADGSLHPVQRSMVECNGSQCGFCTPGFVMSLYALYESDGQTPSRRQIDDCLAGNLCRCTGYRPIVAAARRMFDLDDGDASVLEQRAPDAAALLEAIRPSETLVLRTGERAYFSPTSLADLSELFGQHPDASLLAGGTDVGLWVTKGHRDLNTIIYTGNVRELKEVRVSDTHLEIGAAATYTNALPVIAPHYPPFAELIRRLGSTQIRNSGTIGGNVANGSPIGDSMPALIALGSTLVLRRGAATRELPLDEFYLDYRKTALAPGELVERIRIPIHGGRRRFETYKIAKRFDQDISSVCGAYCLDLDGTRVRDIRICYGGMAATPKRARRCEQVLVGGDWTRETVEHAMTVLVEEDYRPIDDMRASSRYRELVARNLLLRFYLESVGEVTQTQVLQYER